MAKAPPSLSPAPSVGRCRALPMRLDRRSSPGRPLAKNFRLPWEKNFRPWTASRQTHLGRGNSEPTGARRACLSTPAPERGSRAKRTHFDWLELSFFFGVNARRALSFCLCPRRGQPRSGGGSAAPDRAHLIALRSFNSFLF